MLLRFVPPILVAFFCLGLGGCVSRPNQIEGDTLYSPALRLSVTKPPSWQFVGAREVRAARRGVRTTNQHLNYLTYQASAPTVVLMREPRDAAALPAVISMDRYPLGDDRFAAATKVAGFIISNYQAIIPGVKVTVYPIPRKIGRSDVAYCRIKYSLTYADGVITDCEREFWVWAFPLSATVVSAACESRDRVHFQGEIDQAVRSIAFKP